MASGSKGSRRREKIDVQAVDLEPTRRGYQLTYNYAVHFWLPILGPVCFALWQALISFCFGDRDKCWPSISLLADMAAGGNRNLITGRWRRQGENRCRQQGALEELERYGLLTVETKHAGSETRYTFHVVKEPPILTPDLLTRLPKRLRQMHSDLLDRCGLHPETYQHIHRGGAAHGTGGAARGSRGAAHGIGGAAQGSTKHYKESKTLEEIWKETKKALAREMNRSNFDLYVRDTHPLAFDRNLGILIIQTPSPRTTEVLRRQFHTVIMRTIHELALRIQGVPVNDVQFQARR
jgi:hypothetical protein